MYPYLYSLPNPPSSETVRENIDGDVYDRAMEMNQRIYLARREAKLTQSDLAKAVGVTRGAVAQWESGDVRPRHTTLTKIAEATGKSIQWLESGVDEKIVGLTVVGEVAAGMWKEGHISFKQYARPVTPHPDYPADAQRMYRVVGNSLNKLVQDGEFIHCVDVMASGVTPVSGDLVVVRRSEHGRVEYSAKRFIRKNGEATLRPESDDPDFQDDLEITGDDDTEIEIIDIVIAKWKPIPRGSL